MTSNPLTTNDELTRRLDAFAQLRLSPTPEAAARMRARVVGAARATAASATVPTLPRPSQRVPRVRSVRLVRPRLAPALLAAAVGVLIAATAALAANPGGPLYGVRIWAESVSLPSDPDARATAEIARLDARIAEVSRAAGSGDERAIAAALEAYREILEDTVATPPKAGAGSNDALADTLNRHHAVLLDLLDRVTPQARGGISNAIEQSERALAKPHGNGSGDDAGAGNGNGGTPEPNPNATPTPKRDKADQPKPAIAPPGQAKKAGVKPTPPGQLKKSPKP
jgi:hypothetical protein